MERSARKPLTEPESTPFLLALKEKLQIKLIADKAAYGSCFINTIFMNVVLSQEKNGVPQSWGEMYLKALDGGLLQRNGVSTTQYMNRKEGIQKWVDTLIGKDRLVVEGLFPEDRLSAGDIFRRIPELLNSGVLASGGRFLNNSHSMMQFIVNNNWGIFDTGWRREPGARPYGISYREFYRKNNMNSFWILRPR